MTPTEAVAHLRATHAAPGWKAVDTAWNTHAALLDVAEAAAPLAEFMRMAVAVLGGAPTEAQAALASFDAACARLTEAAEEN